MSDTAAAETATEATTETVGLAAMLAGETAATAQATDADSLSQYMRGEEKTATDQAEVNSFLEGITDPDTKAYLERKGFKDPVALGKAYANLERLASRDAAGRVLLPTGAEDAEGYDRVFAALGRPETPEGYEFGQLQGADPEFSNEAAKWLHKAGVPKDRAAALATDWNAYVSQRATAEATAAQQKADAEWAGLRSEWGPQFEEQAMQAKRGAATFGVAVPDLEAMEAALGPAKTMKLMAAVGKALGEDKFIEGAGNAQFGVTKEQAEARIATLQKDAAWQSRWMNGGADEKAEWSRLTRIAGAQ